MILTVRAPTNAISSGLETSLTGLPGPTQGSGRLLTLHAMKTESTDVILVLRRVVYNIIAYITLCSVFLLYHYCTLNLHGVETKKKTPAANS